KFSSLSALICVVVRAGQRNNRLGSFANLIRNRLQPQDRIWKILQFLRDHPSQEDGRLVGRFSLENSIQVFLGKLELSHLELVRCQISSRRGVVRIYLQ